MRILPLVVLWVFQSSIGGTAVCVIASSFLTVNSHACLIAHQLRILSMDPRYMVKQYVAVVQSWIGQKFMVFQSGDDRYYYFDPLDRDGCSCCNGFPVKKTDLRRSIARALAHGWGNATL